MNFGILSLADRIGIASPQSLDSLTVGKPSSDGRADVSSSSYSTPDVQVHLSKLGRQRSIEALEKETVQNVQSAQSYQENRSQQIDSGQSRSVFDRQSNDVDYASVLETEAQDPQYLNIGEHPMITASHYETESNRLQVRDQADARREDQAEIQAAIDRAQVVEVPTTWSNSSQSASVASQYNISPESALGHGVSTFA